MIPITFRQYQASDHDAVIILHKLALEHTDAFAKNGVWDDDLENIPHVYLQNGDFQVGYVDGKLIAMGALKRVSTDIAEIKRMRVHPEYQGKGIGQTLLAMLEAKAKELGYKTIQLDTTVNQKAAIKLYEKNGYKEIRREVEGWPLEMIFYQKDLLSHPDLVP